MRRITFLLTGCLMFGLAAGVCSAEGEPTILLIGDSMVAGTPFFWSPAEAPPHGHGDRTGQFAYGMSQRHPGWVILNRGVRGERTDEVLRRYTDIYRPRQASDYVVVLAGINDLYQGYSPLTAAKTLSRFYEAVRVSGARLVVCTVLPLDRSTPALDKAISDLNHWIRRYAQEQKYLFCDTYAAAEDPARPSRLLDSLDGLHPGKAAQNKIAEELSWVIERDWSARHELSPSRTPSTAS